MIRRVTGTADSTAPGRAGPAPGAYAKPSPASFAQYASSLRSTQRAACAVTRPGDCAVRTVAPRPLAPARRRRRAARCSSRAGAPGAARPATALRPAPALTCAGEFQPAKLNHPPTPNSPAGLGCSTGGSRVFEATIRNKRAIKVHRGAIKVPGLTIKVFIRARCQGGDGVVVRALRRLEELHGEAGHSGAQHGQGVGGVAVIEGAGEVVGGAGERVGELQDPAARTGRLVLGGGRQDARRERERGGSRLRGRAGDGWLGTGGEAPAGGLRLARQITVGPRAALRRRRQRGLAPAAPGAGTARSEGSSFHSGASEVTSGS